MSSQNDRRVRSVSHHARRYGTESWEKDCIPRETGGVEMEARTRNVLRRPAARGCVRRNHGGENGREPRP